MKRLSLILLIIAALSLTLTAKRVSTKRTGLKAKPKVEATINDSTRALACDTLVNVPASVVTISGYDKALRSHHESFFVSNHLPDKQKLLSIQVRITYTDTKGRQLHTRTEWVQCNLPAGETRIYTIRTWDRQTSFYYRRSQKPKRASGTPYDVKFEVIRAVF